MRLHRLGLVTVAALSLFASGSATAQSTGSVVHLVVPAGTPLRVALDEKISVKRAGQKVTATVLEPVYAYDRIVVPAGTKALGHVERIETTHGGTRVRAALSGDFTPPRIALVEFDKLIASDGRETSMTTAVSTGVENVALRVADSKESESGVVSRAREEAARQAKQAIALVRAPGKMERLKDAAIQSLPYHPTYLAKGTVYSARLVSPLDFGEAMRTEPAAPGSTPAPDSILNARLATPLDSIASPRGTRIEAVLTQPVFSADHRLILPEGTRLRGEVTFSAPARRFHRNGKLRFLFESVQVPDAAEQTLLGSLYSVESGQGSRLAIDEEGGAAGTSSNARFVAPAIGALALVASMHGAVETGSDSPVPETIYGSPASNIAGGLLGLAAVGAVVAQLSHPAAVALSAFGLARTGYSAVFGRGHDVAFPADSSIQIRLAPGPGEKKK
jgi:hypothetical protein